MGYVILAPVGDNLKALFVGMKEFATEKVYLITPKERLHAAKELKSKLAEFTISTTIIEIGSNIMEEMFRVFGELCSLHDPDDLIVNVATGDRISTCSALSASFANGLKAIGVMNDMCVVMPIMKLSYYHELNENKLKVLKQLDPKEFISLSDLAKRAKMSASLTSYHLNGNNKYKGLKEYRLVETQERDKRVFVRLSHMGKLLLKGYIKPKQ